MNANVENQEGQTPLQIALETNHLEAAKSLLEHRASAPNPSSQWIIKLAFQSVDNDELTTLEKLINYYNVSTQAKNDSDETLLYYILKNGSIENIRMVFNSENTVFPEKNIPWIIDMFFEASQDDEWEILQLFLNMELVDVNIEYEGKTAIQVATTYGNINSIDVLLSTGAIFDKDAPWAQEAILRTSPTTEEKPSNPADWDSELFELLSRHGIIQPQE